MRRGRGTEITEIGKRATDFWFWEVSDTGGGGKRRIVRSGGSLRRRDRTYVICPAAQQTEKKQAPDSE